MKNKQLLIDILKYIDLNLYSKISINDLSQNFYFNKDYIMRIFKKKFGITIIDYINKKRIFNSLNALKDNNKLILSISIEYGFISQEYYCEIFKKIIGVSPNIYRKFIYNLQSISYDDIAKIRKNLTDLNKELKIIENYKYSKSIEFVKKLSLNYHHYN